MSINCSINKFYPNVRPHNWVQNSLNPSRTGKSPFLLESRFATRWMPATRFPTRVELFLLARPKLLRTLLLLMSWTLTEISYGIKRSESKANHPFTQRASPSSPLLALQHKDEFYAPSFGCVSSKNNLRANESCLNPTNKGISTWTTKHGQTSISDRHSGSNNLYPRHTISD
jgi:hypothetical protein